MTCPAVYAHMPVLLITFRDSSLHAFSWLRRGVAHGKPFSRSAKWCELKTNHTILFCIQKLQSKCEQWRHVRHVALNSHGTE